MILRICVFCGSAPGRDDNYTTKVQEMGKELVNRNIGLVYGGASIGAMGALADAVLGAGGEAIGVIPAALAGTELVHPRLTNTVVVDTMHERKAKMSQLSDAFIALPGGAGTIEEFFEAWTWAQLDIHTKPCGLLNIHNYFDHLLAFITHATKEEFLEQRALNSLLVATEPSTLLDQIFEYTAPPARFAWKQSGQNDPRIKR